VNLEVASYAGRDMHPPSVHKLIVLRRCDEGVTQIEALFFLGRSPNVTVDSPLAKSSSLAHCVKTVIERRQKIRIMNIMSAAGSWGIARRWMA
jgi:hypothetical protein